MVKKLISPLLFAGLLAGCKSPAPQSLANSPDAPTIRNNGYSLMYDLFNDEKDVSVLRFIRPEQTDIKDLTKTISSASKTAAQELEGFARRDPSIHLHDLWLPPGEVATRDAISKTKEKALLTKKGREFELNLLLTQTEALNYAWHIAAVTARYEPDPERARALNDLAHEMEDLFHRAFDLELNLPQPKG